MINRVNKIFIGKDIDANAALVAGADITTVQENIAEGEIVILDQNMKVIDATATYPTVTKIYIAEGSAEIFNTADASGNAITGRRLLLSDPISAKGVIRYTGKDYAAKAEMTATVPAITDTIVPGTEYVFRLVYKDRPESVLQAIDTYRYISKSGDTSTDVFDGIRRRINKDNGKLGIKGKAGARVTANALGEATLVVTAKPIPEYTTRVESIDDFDMVKFEVRLNYVDNDYDWQKVTTSSEITYTDASMGNGIWEKTRDKEKQVLSYEGVTNRVHFPAIKPDLRTIKGAAYDTIVIEHDAIYRSPNVSMMEEFPLTTELALQTQANGTNLGNMSAAIVATLNNWMGSIPFSQPAYA